MSDEHDDWVEGLGVNISQQVSEQAGNEQAGDDGGGGQGDGSEMRQITAALRTHYEANVSYWIYDQGPNGPKVLVNGDKHKGGDVIWLTFDSSDGSGGTAAYQRDSYEEGGGTTPITTTLVTSGQITDMIL